MAKKKTANKKKAVRPGDTLPGGITAEAPGLTDNIVKVVIGVPTLDPPEPEDVVMAGVDVCEDSVSASVRPGELLALPPQVEARRMDLGTTSIIEVPLRGEYNLGPGHLDAQLSRTQNSILRRIQDGLVFRHAKTADGKPVYSRASVLKWMIEEIGGTNGDG